MRKTSQRKTERENNSYSTLSRGPTQHLQSQPLHTPNDLYDHIQLSPSTGQAEFISKTKTDNTNNPSPHHHQESIYLSDETKQPQSSAIQITISSNSISHGDSATLDQPTYAVVNKKKHTTGKEPDHYPPNSFSATKHSITKQNAAKAMESVYFKHENTADKDLQLSTTKESQPKFNQDI